MVESDDMAGRRVLATEPGVGPRDMDAGSSCMKVSSPKTTFQAQELSSVDPSWRLPRSTQCGEESDLGSLGLAPSLVCF